MIYLAGLSSLKPWLNVIGYYGRNVSPATDNEVHLSIQYIYYYRWQIIRTEWTPDSAHFKSITTDNRLSDK